MIDWNKPWKASRMSRNGFVSAAGATASSSALAFSLALGLISPLSGAYAADNDYPIRPVSLVVPFSPGGITDGVARVVADGLGKKLGKTVVVENKPGAGGAIARDYVQRAKPDGYTLLFGSRVTQITNPLVQQTPVPTGDQFTPISTVCDVAAVIVANPDRPYKTLKELIGYAKQHPGDITYATAGNGTAAHLAAASFMELTGIKMTHVPYKGSAPAVQDVMGGMVDIAFDWPTSTAAYIDDKRLLGLASLSESRMPLLPNVPTAAQAGVPGAETSSWQAIIGPGGMPKPIVQTLESALAQTINDPQVQKKLIQLGTVPLIVSGPDLDALIVKETDHWRGVVDRAHINAR